MRVLLLSDDLLFGSRLLAELSAAGHEVSSTAGALPSPPPADLIVVDLTVDAPARIAQLAGIAGRPPVLGYFSHVEADVRTQALTAGLERVVPRSRMAREAVSLVAATES